MNRPGYDEALASYRKKISDAEPKEPLSTPEEVGARLTQLSTLENNDLWREFVVWISSVENTSAEEMERVKSSFSAGRAYGKYILAKAAREWVETQAVAAQARLEQLRSERGDHG